MKEERRKIMKARKEGKEGSARQMKTVKNKIEKKRRKRREMILREKISELETCYQARDTRKLEETEGAGRMEEERRKDTRNRGG